MTSPDRVAHGRLDPAAFHQRWTHRLLGHTMTLDAVVHRGDEFELTGTLDPATGPRKHLVYVYDALDLALGTTPEFLAQPPTAADLFRLVGFLIDHLGSWADLDVISPDTVDDLLHHTRPDLTVALLTVQTATGVEAPDTLRSLVALDHTDPEFVATALMAGLTTTEAAMLPPGHPSVLSGTERANLLHQWRFLAALRGAPT